MADRAGGSGVWRWASVSESNDRLLRRDALLKLFEEPRSEDAGLKKLLDANGFGRFMGTCGCLEP